MTGRDLDDVAREWGLSNDDALEKLLPDMGIFFIMEENDVQRILTHALTLNGSNAIAGGNHPHPRARLGHLPTGSGPQSRCRNSSPLGLSRSGATAATPGETAHIHEHVPVMQSDDIISPDLTWAFDIQTALAEASRKSENVSPRSAERSGSPSPHQNQPPARSRASPLGRHQAPPCVEMADGRACGQFRPSNFLFRDAHSRMVRSKD